MRKTRLPLALTGFITATAVWAGPLSDWFERKSKSAGPEQVAALLSTLQTDANPSKRARAAEDLAHFDGQAHPEIAAALINSLQQDSSVAVRREAAQSLGRLRPASQEAALALDQAVTHDSALIVRLQARSARLGYHPPPTPPAKPETSSSMPALKPPNPPAVTRPLPKLIDEIDNPNPAEPGRFLPEDLPRLLPPLPIERKVKKESESKEGGGILVAPPRSNNE